MNLGSRLPASICNGEPTLRSARRPRAQKLTKECATHLGVHLLVLVEPVRALTLARVPLLRLDNERRPLVAAAAVERRHVVERREPGCRAGAEADALSGRELVEVLDPVAEGAFLLQARGGQRRSE